MKPLDNAFAKLNALRKSSSGARRGRRLLVMSSQEEADSFPVKVQHLQGSLDALVPEAPATEPVEPRNVPRPNGKEK